MYVWIKLNMLIHLTLHKELGNIIVILYIALGKCTVCMQIKMDKILKGHIKTSDLV